ncbi:hypothetical protein BASA61_000650, partial [Batrachochytrium salamandrivorans]
VIRSATSSSFEDPRSAISSSFEDPRSTTSLSFEDPRSTTSSSLSKVIRSPTFSSFENSGSSVSTSFNCAPPDASSPDGLFSILGNYDNSQLEEKSNCPAPFFWVFCAILNHFHDLTKLVRKLEFIRFDVFSMHFQTSRRLSSDIPNNFNKLKYSDFVSKTTL